MEVISKENEVITMEVEEGILALSIFSLSNKSCVGTYQTGICKLSGMFEAEYILQITDYAWGLE